jgi:hypothetical protein
MRRLDVPSDLPIVRREIALAMLDHLHSLRETPRRWDKAHFANAVAALAMNIHSVQQPTQAWLRLCLVDFRKAIEPAAPHSPYLLHERHLDAVTLEELIATIEGLGGWDVKQTAAENQPERRITR